MSTEAANAAIERIETDDALAARLREAGSADAGLAVLREAGFDVTQDDMRDAVLDRYGDSLTPEQLDEVQAGLSHGEPMGEFEFGLVIATAVAALAV